MMDATGYKICERIKEKVNKKFDLNLTIEEIYKYARSQFNLMEHFMEDEEEIKIDYLGKFTIKRKRREVMLKHDDFKKFYKRMSKKPIDNTDSVEQIEFE